MQNNGRSHKKWNIKRFKTHCETLYDKTEEHILNIIVQGSDNKILLSKIVFNEGKCYLLPSDKVFLTTFSFYLVGLFSPI